MGSDDYLTIIIFCVVLIGISLISTYIRLQTLQVIANNTTQKQFDEYLHMRIAFSLIGIVIVVFYLFKKK
jgi:hypothetical protein